MPILGQKRMILRDADKLYCIRSFSFMGEEWERGALFKPKVLPDHLRDRLYRQHFIGLTPPPGIPKKKKVAKPEKEEVKTSPVVAAARRTRPAAGATA